MLSQRYSQNEDHSEGVSSVITPSALFHAFLSLLSPYPAELEYQ